MIELILIFIIAIVLFSYYFYYFSIKDETFNYALASSPPSMILPSFTAQNAVCLQCVTDISNSCGSPVNPITISDPINTGFAYCLNEQFLKLNNNKRCANVVKNILNGSPVNCNL